MRRTFGETADPALEDNALAAASDGTGEASLLAGLTTEQVVFLFSRIFKGQIRQIWPFLKLLTTNNMF